MSLYVGCVCLFVPPAGTGNLVDWRLLAEEDIAKISKLRNFFLEGLDNYFGLENVFRFLGGFCLFPIQESFLAD